MKARFVLENDYGYDHETSVLMDVEAIPRVGETVWIDTSELFKNVFSVENNHVFYCKGISIFDTDILTVCRVKHVLTKDDYGIYVILVYNYEDYLKGNFIDENCISHSDIAEYL